ncbi:MAG: type IV secretion system DNA-binding domain-containing protein [Minisyncoccia bacterium]
MMDEPLDLTPLGYYNFRHQQKKFGIKIDDRRRHIYVIGKTGVGKTTLLENMAIADIRSGKGIAIVDPHGEFAEKMLDFVPEERLDDVIYFDPSDMEFPVAFNPMEQVGTEYRHLIASGLMGVFKKIWADAWSARMQYILNNTLLALLENPGATLLGILRMFSNPAYRKQIVDNLRDPVIKAFWQDEFSKYSQKFETEALAAIQNKVGQFVSNPLVRNILGQSHSSLNMRDIMDSGKIFICNLSKGKIGEDNSALLGAMIITRLQLAAMSRVDLVEENRRDFFLYVDEFQNFATESFANILSEARKYRLSLVLAHQYIGQLRTGDSTMVRDAVFGNVGTIIAFRVGAEDAEFLEKEFMPEFLQNDLVNLSKANIYIKLMIDGVASRPFSAETMPPQKVPLDSYRDVIIKNSREHYGTPKAVVEAHIASEWRVGGSEAPASRSAEPQQRGQRLSEALVPNSRMKAPPGVRNFRDVRDVEPRRAPMAEVKPVTVKVPEERKAPQQVASQQAVPDPIRSDKAGQSASEASEHRMEQEPVRDVPRILSVLPREAPQGPRKVLHPNVDIDALKRAINESLKKKEG